MAVKAVQQIQLGTVMGTEEQALKTMRLMKEAGYDGIELNGFMIKKMPPIVKILTKMAGMPVGNGGKLDWKKLMGQSGLSVVSVHEDLGSIKRAPEEIIAEAESFGTHYVVITGMHMFDYSDGEAVKTLAEDLNTAAGKRLKEGGISLLYHNHNCEFLRVTPDMTAYEYIIEHTDPEYVNFEFDSYWPTETGADAKIWMRRLGRADEAVAHQRPGLPSAGKGRFHLKVRQHGAGLRQYGSGGHDRHRQGERHRRGGSGEPQKLGGQIPGQILPAVGGVSEPAFLMYSRYSLGVI